MSDQILTRDAALLHPCPTCGAPRWDGYAFSREIAHCHPTCHPHALDGLPAHIVITPGDAYDTKETA